jgi:A/G-specific adenine glycosylase
MCEAKNSINSPPITIIYYFHLMPKSPAKKNKQLPSRILTPAEKRAFRRTLYAYFAEHGRDLPWRNSSDPYHIVVSEIMLQQTQVDRVIARFETFIATFPTFESLDNAQLADVYAVWQGLGYNRRALALKRIAALVVHEHNGMLPQSTDILATFPGIGRATAASICTYAFNMPAVYVETNIRSVFIHLFFNDRLQVDDAEISALVEQTLDRAHPAKWYSALMDYGTMLKKAHPNPSRKSKTHSVQSPFKGSRRQVRGAIMRLVSAQPGLTALQLSKHISNNSTDIITAIAQSLCTEGMLSQTGKRYFIASI